MKKIIVISVLLLSSVCVLAAQEKQYWSPKKGDWAIGITFNPASLSYQMLAQPKPGDFVGNWISENAASPRQMFMLAQDPIASFRIKYHTSEHWAIRASLGFSGSVVNYMEYVSDDLAVAANPDSQNKVVDEVSSRLNSGSLLLGTEYKTGAKAVKFVFGFDVFYAIGGGLLSFDYGNKMTDLNHIPSSMPMTAKMKEGSVNDFSEKLGIAYGRPVERYNSGYIHSVGLSLDMGLEVFLAEKISVGLSMNFTPVAFTFQPQTHTTYEGFSANTGKVEQYTGLVSPGSNALLYGTENIGGRLSLNYYF